MATKIDNKQKITLKKETKDLGHAYITGFYMERDPTVALNAFHVSPPKGGCASRFCLPHIAVLN